MPVPAARPASRLVLLGAVGAIVLAACSPATASPVGASQGPSGAPSAVASAPSAPSSAAPSPASASGSPASSSPAAEPATLLLEVHHEGGFINPAASIGALPLVVVDTDGRIYTPSASTDGSDRLIAAVQVQDTGTAGAAAIQAAAAAAGLVDGSGGGGVAADTGSTVFTLETPGGEVVTRVASGGPGGPIGGPGHPSAPAGSPAAPGAAALDLLAKLQDPSTAWGGVVAPAVPLTPPAYRVWVAPEAAGGTGGAAAAWPLAADPNTFGTPAAANFGVDGLRSGLVIGADATGLAKALGALPAGSDLSYQGHAYRVWVRPVLPDELAA